MDSDRTTKVWDCLGYMSDLFTFCVTTWRCDTVKSAYSSTWLGSLLRLKCYKLHRIICCFDTNEPFLRFRDFVLQVEFAVQITCETCADKIRAALQEKPGRLKKIVKYELSLLKGFVLCTTIRHLLPGKTRNLVEDDGRRWKPMTQMKMKARFLALLLVHVSNVINKTGSFWWPRSLKVKYVQMTEKSSDFYLHLWNNPFLLNNQLGTICTVCNRHFHCNSSSCYL